VTSLIAIISDTHLPRGERSLPEGCTRWLRQADLILHAGDFSTAAVFGQLSALGPPLRGVHGNVDEPALQHLLPATLELDVEGVKIAMLHDAGVARGRMARLRRRFPSATAVIFGHSHLPLQEWNGDGFQIFNPGSPTDRRRAPAHTMGLARVDLTSLSLEHIVV
jgi:putative phosphoesterase